MDSTWKGVFASGLVVMTPLFVTVMALVWLYNHLVKVPLPVDSAPLRVVLTIVLFVLLVFSVGYLMRTAVGVFVEDTIDNLMNRLPGLRVVYNASKMASETALADTDELQEPVKFETWNGLRMTAFKTGKQTDDGQEILFLPTSPNVTSGFTVEVEPREYEGLDETVEEALTRIISAGFGEDTDRSISIDVEEEVPSDEGNEAPEI